MSSTVHKTLLSSLPKDPPPSKHLSSSHLLHSSHPHLSSHAPPLSTRKTAPLRTRTSPPSRKVCFLQVQPTISEQALSPVPGHSPSTLRTLSGELTIPSMGEGLVSDLPCSPTVWCPAPSALPTTPYSSAEALSPSSARSQDGAATNLPLNPKPTPAITPPLPSTMPSTPPSAQGGGNEVSRKSSGLSMIQRLSPIKRRLEGKSPFKQRQLSKPSEDTKESLPHQPPLLLPSIIQGSIRPSAQTPQGKRGERVGAKPQKQGATPRHSEAQRELFATSSTRSTTHFLTEQASTESKGILYIQDARHGVPESKIKQFQTTDDAQRQPSDSQAS